MTYSNQTVGDFTNWAKPFGNAFSTLGWVNSNDFGSIQGNATFGSATISNVQINNGVLQITYTGATNQFTSGQALLLSGLTTNTFLNNQIIRIQNILGPLSLYTTTIFNSTGTVTVAASVGGNATYSLPNTTSVATNLEAGTTVVITGFTNLSNNGTFYIVSNTAFTITVNNPSAVVETHASINISALALTKNTAYSGSSVAASVGSTAVYTVPAPALSAIPNLYAGATFIVTGFTNLSNNGTFVCTASNANSLTLYNANAVAETHAATLTQQPDATNTVFTAYFNHPDVAPVSDTGTATIVYGWNTITNVPDIVTNGSTAVFPIGQSIRWRGAYVGITPIFTNLQTTANLTTISFGSNGHGFDLTYSKGLSVLINGITNAAFTWLNESSGFIPWPIVSLTSTTITINTGASPRTDIASTPVTAGIASPGYTGGLQASTGPFGEATCDVVTYNGDLYIACSASLVGGAYFSNTLNALITVPGTGAVGSKFWSRFAYDIWKSNDSLTSTNPIIFKVLYGNDGGNRPILYFYWGCATDGTGNITTNYNWGPNQIFSPATGGSTGVSTIGPNTGTTDTAPWESDFSGAPGRFACIPWRGYTQGTSGPQFLLNIERSHDNSGNDTDAYWTVLFIGQPNNGVNSTTGNWFAMTQSIFKPGTGGAGPMYAINNGQANTLNGTVALSPLPTINIPNATSLSFNNSIPVLPVFPLVGYVGNPMIGTIIMKAGDTSDGALVTASFYGTSHPYLMCTRGGCAAAGPFMVNNSPGFNSAMGIRWE
jgi:hypothetical protein